MSHGAARLAQWGWTFGISDMDADGAERLPNDDVAERIGGNPLSPIHSARKARPEGVPGTIAGKIPIDRSAAAFAFIPPLLLANEDAPEMNSVGIKDFRGLAPQTRRRRIRFARFGERYACNTGVMRWSGGGGLRIAGKNLLRSGRTFNVKRGVGWLGRLPGFACGEGAQKSSDSQRPYQEALDMKKRRSPFCRAAPFSCLRKASIQLPCLLLRYAISSPPL